MNFVVHEKSDAPRVVFDRLGGLREHAPHIFSPVGACGVNVHPAGSVGAREIIGSAAESSRRELKRVGNFVFLRDGAIRAAAHGVQTPTLQTLQKAVTSDIAPVVSIFGLKVLGQKIARRRIFVEALASLDSCGTLIEPNAVEAVRPEEVSIGIN